VAEARATELEGKVFALEANVAYYQQAQADYETLKAQAEEMQQRLAGYGG
jgi:hypothetical protein